jgi:hypothetical protein
MAVAAHLLSPVGPGETFYEHRVAILDSGFSIPVNTGYLRDGKLLQEVVIHQSGTEGLEIAALLHLFHKLREQSLLLTMMGGGGGGSRCRFLRSLLLKRRRGGGGGRGGGGRGGGGRGGGGRGGGGRG